MGVRVKFSVFGEKQVDLLLERLELDRRDMSPLWDSLARSFAYYMRRQFSSEGAEFGNKWPGVISPRYRAIKQIYYPDRPTLVASGRLKQSLTSTPLGVQEYGKFSARFGTDVPYARYHHRGISRSTKMSFKVGDHWVTIHGLPQRKIIGMNQSMQTSWRKKIQRFLVRGQTTPGEEI